MPEKTWVVRKSELSDLALTIDHWPKLLPLYERCGARLDTQQVGCLDTAALFSDIVEDLGTQEVRKTGAQDIPYFLGVLKSLYSSDDKGS